MTSFRRLVIGIAEFFLVVSMIVFTFVSGIVGAAIGSIYFDSTSVHFANSGSVGAVVGFCLGALIGFTVTCSTAAIVFALIQIERNTRPLDGEFLPNSRNGYRPEPRF
jgi:large-conductance mechanosensitive channel